MKIWKTLFKCPHLQMFYRFMYASKKELTKVIVIYVIGVLLVSYSYLDSYFEKNKELNNLTIDSIQKEHDPDSLNSTTQKRFTYYNPYLITDKELQAMGLSVKDANKYLRYRNKMGAKWSLYYIKKLYIDEKLKDSLSFYAEFKKQSKKNKERSNAPLKENRVTKSIHKQCRVNLNTDDLDSLKAIDGIGEVLSKRIVKYGEALGGYLSIDQLKEVYYYPLESHHIISQSLFISTPVSVVKLDVNKVSFKDLLHHPYFDYEQVKMIFKEKDLNGAYKSWGEFKKRVLMKEETYIKIAPYLKFEGES